MLFENFTLAHAERAAVERALKEAGGNKQKTAKLLNVSRSTLYRKLELYRLSDAEIVRILDEMAK